MLQPKASFTTSSPAAQVLQVSQGAARLLDVLEGLEPFTCILRFCIFCPRLCHKVEDVAWL